MPRFTTLYSGSSGNCSVLEQNGKFIMLDMGGTCKSTLAGLVHLGLTPRELGGIFITHEHTDHIKGLMVFLKKVKVPVFGTLGTLEEVAGYVPPGTELVAIAPGQPVEVGGFQVQGFSTSHDSADSCGWRVVTNSGRVMALATDLGCMTDEVYDHLRDAHVVALEANYDPVLLRTGPYPAYLKRRISSATGHLSNADSAKTVVRLVQEGCRRVVLVHLSKENNTPMLVEKAVEDAFYQCGAKCPPDCIVQVAGRHQVGPWLEF